VAKRTHCTRGCSPPFPAAGEIAIFDRSWYNRAGVEYVMGFCSERDHRRFLELCPEIDCRGRISMPRTEP
jgi:polyphosphate kinase 2 (PPK2 family)